MIINKIETSGSFESITSADHVGISICSEHDQMVKVTANGVTPAPMVTSEITLTFTREGEEVGEDTWWVLTGPGKTESKILSDYLTKVYGRKISVDLGG